MPPVVGRPVPARALQVVIAAAAVAVSAVTLPGSAAAASGESSAGASLPRASLSRASAPQTAQAPATATPSPPTGPAPMQRSQARSTLGTITAPVDHAAVDVTPTFVVVRVAVAAGARLAALRANGRNVTTRLTRRTGAATATLRLTDGLAIGRNTVTATLVRGTRTAYVHSRFVLARPRQGLAVITSPSTGSRLAPATAAVGVAVVAGATFVAALNGTTVTARFSSAGRGRWRAALGPSAGLRHGRNTLSVVAVAPTGSMQRLTRTFIVLGTGPLADAGADRTAATGVAVVLDGRASAAPPGRPGVLTHGWSVVGRPAGSSPRLTAATTARPVLITSVPGRYVLRHTVRAPSGSVGARVTAPAALAVATDDAVVSVSPSGPVVDVRAVPAAATTAAGIRIGPGFYPSSVAGPGVQLLVLDTATLGLVSNTSYPAGSMGSFASAITAATGQAAAADQYFVLASLPGGPPTSSRTDLGNLARGVLTLGCGGLPRSGAALGVVAIPNQKLPPLGTCWGAPLGLDGRFVTAINASTGVASGWTFTFADTVTIDTAVPDPPAGVANVVRVGTATYSVPVPPAGTGGFQVVSLDATTLTGSSTYFPMPSGAAGIAAALGRADTVVVVVAVGNLSGVYQAGGGLGPVSSRLAAIGGSPGVFDLLGGNDSYSFVGPTPAGQYPAEGSNRIVPGSTGRVTTFLARGRDGEFAPQAADVTGSADLSATLADVAYQQPTAWPYTRTASQRAALAYVSRQLGLGCTGGSCDVRRYYTTGNSMADAYVTIYRIRNTGCAALGPTCASGFLSSDFLKVRNQLALEFPMVDEVNEYISQVQSLYTDGSGQLSGNLTPILNGVTTSLSSTSSSAAVVSYVLSLMTDLLWAASLVTVTAFAPYATVAGVLAVAAATASSLATTPGSGSPVQQVQTDGVGFIAAMQAQLGDAATGIALLGDGVVTDFGRLKRAAGLATAGKGPWNLGTTQLTSVKAAMQAGLAQSFLTSLLPVAYPAYGWTSDPEQPFVPGQNNASTFGCSIHTGNQPLNGQMLVPNYPLAGGAYDYNLYIIYRAGHDPYDSWNIWSPSYPPSQSLTNMVFDPYSVWVGTTPGAAGAFAPWFWGRTYLRGSVPLRSC